MRAEAAVVGGGPAGLLAARALAEAGLEPTIIEEDEVVGRPERCAGLFSIKGLERLGIPAAGRYVQNRVRGAVFYSPSGRSFTVDAGGEVAVVADRSTFDEMLLEEALSRGAKIIYGARADSVEKAGGKFVVKLRHGGGVEADYLLDAEGMSALIAKRFLGRRPPREDWIPIIQVVVEGHGEDERYVYLYFRNYLPDFFAYLVPIDGGLGKVGVAARSQLRKKLERFLSEIFPRAKVLRYSAHAIYTGFPMEPWADSKFWILGDAAGHVKATTGGGVVMGGAIALETGRALAARLSGKDAKEHMRRIQTILSELRKIALIRRLVSKIPLKLYDGIFSALQDSGAAELLGRGGDMDYQFSGLWRIIRGRGFPATAARALSRFLKSLLG